MFDKNKVFNKREPVCIITKSCLCLKQRVVDSKVVIPKVLYLRYSQVQENFTKIEWYIWKFDIIFLTLLGSSDDKNDI